MRARQEKSKQGPSRNAGQRFRAKFRAEGVSSHLELVLQCKQQPLNPQAKMLESSSPNPKTLLTL